MKRLSFALAALAMLAGCTTTNETIAPASTGQIRGTLQSLFEMDCSTSKSMEGVNVEILDTKFSTVTDQRGHWELDNIPAGYYQFRFSKPGFSQRYMGPVPFVGAGTLLWDLGGPQMQRLTTWNITISPPSKIVKHTYDTTWESYDLTFSTPPTTRDTAGKAVSGATLYWFCGKSPNIDYRDTTTYLGYFAAFYSANFYFPKNSVHSGDTLYAVAYNLGCGVTLRTGYYVGDTLKYEWAGFGKPSNVVSFVLP